MLTILSRAIKPSVCCTIATYLLAAMIFKSPICFLTVIPCAFFTFILCLPPALASSLKCANAVLTNFDMKEGINFTTYACAEWVARTEVNSISNTTHLDERQFATGCVNPPPKCQVNSLCTKDHDLYSYGQYIN